MGDHYTCGKISDLTSFLYASIPTLDSVARFLALDTFSEFAPTSLILSRLEIDRSISVVGSFGINQIALDKTLDYVSNPDNPLLEAIRRDEIIEIDGAESSSPISMTIKNAGLPEEGVDFSIIWPIYYIGAGILHFEKKFELGAVDRLFFRAIGGMLALTDACLSLLLEESTLKMASAVQSQNNRRKFGLVNTDESRKNIKIRSEDPSEANLEELTPRQSIILAELGRGKTNSSIAEDLNYSESLIRQETIEIYRKMGISGRRELLKDAKSG